MNPQVRSRYHSDLLAAILAAAPIEFGPSNPLAAKLVSAPTNQQQLARIAASEASGAAVPICYSAGLKLYQLHVPADLVLDGLSWRGAARDRLKHIVGRTLLYMLLLATLAVAGIAFQHWAVDPRVDAFRQHGLLELPLDTADADLRDRTPARSTLRTTAMLGSIAILTAIVGLVAMGPIRLASWIGGRRYAEDRACWVAARVVASLIASGTEKELAVQLATDLLGGLPIVKHRLDQTLAEHGPGDNEHPAELANRFASLAQHHANASSDRIAGMQALIPASMTTLIGGLIALAYGIAVFYPLINVLNELGDSF